jgi:hypothetical protein
MPEETKMDEIQPEGEGIIQADTDTRDAYAKMLKENRSWGFWLLGIGILHIVTSGFLSAPWGIMLILVGLASFYFRTASMFIVYAVTLSWAAISNIMSLETGWIFFAAFQVFLAIRVFQQYRQFRGVEDEYFRLIPDDVMKKPSKRAARFFPWLGSILGCSSIIGLILVFLAVIVFVVAAENATEVPGTFGFIEGLIVNFGILGFALSLGSLLSAYRPKAAAIVGLVASIITLLFEVVLFFL